MTDCGCYEKDLSKLTSGELKREIESLWKKLEMKDREISQLKTTLEKFVEPETDKDEILDMRRQANDALKDALDKADAIIKEAKETAVKIVEHARAVKESIEKGEEEPELVLPGSRELFVSDDLLKTSVKKEWTVKPGSSFAEYFVKKEEPAKEPETAVKDIKAEKAFCCGNERHHVFEEYVVSKQETAIAKRPVAAPAVITEEKRLCVCSNHHVFEEYIDDNHKISLPPRAADKLVVVSKAADACGRTRHVFEEYFAPKEEKTAAPEKKTVGAADGWRALVDSLHK